MTIPGIVLIDVLVLLFIAFTLFLLRSGRIYSSYAALWIGAALALGVLVSIPSLLSLVTRVVGAIFPVSVLTLIGFVFVFLVLVLFSVKLTQLHDRQTELIQVLALRELEERERAGPTPDSQHGPGNP